MILLIVLWMHTTIARRTTPMESSSSSSSDTQKTACCYVVVARHGERLDYVRREAGDNWNAQADRPYDPPLTYHGKYQATKLGQHLATGSDLKELDLPPISCIYTSPFLRCIQTSLSAQKGMMMVQSCDSTAPPPPPPVRLEYGLAESINEAWYRSWALPGSDGTWAFQRNSVLDPSTFHPLSKQPIQTLLDECCCKQLKQQQDQADNDNDNGIDSAHVSKTTIASSYSFHPCHLESRKQQRVRMKQTLDALAGGPGTTVLLVTHGGPATHLFEELTGQPWSVHGDSVYCCYSIYKGATTTTTTKNPGTTNSDGASCSSLTWTPIRVNQFEYLNESDLQGDNYVDNNTS